ncbi:IS5 family transposase [Parasediminibacterium sp. JCM 36343]|uniref:IS5 family transposase n=1 Tax=Parasediminibacterium sp. JCM 36343 TaxID=3374279 RepID=UPI00397D0B57
MSNDKHKVRNWSEYNTSLEKRGDINIWVPADLVETWQVVYADKDIRLKGGQPVYSDAAMLFCLTVKYVYKLPYRGNKGFISSLFKLMRLSLPVPSYSQVCKRGQVLDFMQLVGDSKKATDIAIDSTGLKVYGEGEWKVRKHGASKRRTWMKLHLGIDVETQEIVGVELTENKVDDAACVAPILESIAATGRGVKSFRGDGAYDKTKVRKVLHGAGIKQIIPPQENAVARTGKKAWMGERDAAIEQIKKTGLEDWKTTAGYHKRSLAETAMFRYKTIHGGVLCSRIMENQKTEVNIKCKVLNVYRGIAVPNSYKVA